MSKSKEKSELEYLRSMVKKLKSENRHLKKSVSRSNKRSYLSEQIEKEIVEEMLEDEQQDFIQLEYEKCPKCKAKIDVIEIGNRKLYCCETCNYRTSKKTS